MKPTTNAQKGFTLIELLLAMAFFGSVLIIATLLLTQTLNIYNKGMTVKQMNQVGRTLMEDISRVGSSGESVNMGTDTNGNVNCISIDGTIYLWNIADTSGSGPVANNGYIQPEYRYSDAGNAPVNFVKLTNQENTCSSLGSSISKASASNVVGDTVRVYDMNIETIPNSRLVSVRMLLGTFDTVGSDYNLINNAGNFECKPGGVGNFCAKAEFKTVLYVPNGGLN